MDRARLDCRDGWSARRLDATLILTLRGDWRFGNGVAGPSVADALVSPPDLTGITFETAALGHWDSSLLSFLVSLRVSCCKRGIRFDPAGLPIPTRGLLDMLPAVAPQALREANYGPGPIERVGRVVRLVGVAFRDVTGLVGEAVLRTAPAIRGRAQTRLSDLWTFAQDAGTGALPMVALVNVLVGGIVAFVGAIQLVRFGAAIYVSSLIGAMEVREMAPLMTAIVMSGRTGSAYAAEIATMNGSDEIDALRALGISLFDYLILPRLTALSAMMPLLFIYAAAIGIAGGLGVAVRLMNLSIGGFFVHLRSAVTLSDLMLGFLKSLAFGVWIALSGCRIGLNAGRSATDVGNAATAAAVDGIVGVIALDALFDVCAHALRI